MPKLRPVLDTVALRVMAFAHPAGLSILLSALGVPSARFPREVYNLDEGTDQDFYDISEFARGLRLAAMRAGDKKEPDASRYRTWLQNARQIAPLLRDGTLVIDPLRVDELPLRERLMRDHGIGLGEAASLTLALRENVPVVFVSSDEDAGKVARKIGVELFTLKDMLVRWIDRADLSVELYTELVDGMANAKFRLSQIEAVALQERVRRRM